MNPLYSKCERPYYIPAAGPARLWDKTQASFSHIFSCNPFSCNPLPSQPYLAPPASRASIVWDNVRVILAKTPLQQADLDEITALEETLISTHQHYQSITLLLVKKARDEGNPEYFDYAVWMASKSGFRDKDFHIKWVRQTQAAIKLVKLP